MPKRPLVIIHGYSDKGESFRGWRDILVNRLGYSPSQVHICSYRSLTNEISIRDIAEGFDRALRLQTSLNEGQPFDAIVHSTGMLVIRAWLTQYGATKAPLRNLIALAPATFGSPLAHKGRSFIGSAFKGETIPFSVPPSAHRTCLCFVVPSPMAASAGSSTNRAPTAPCVGPVRRSIRASSYSI